MDKTNVEIEVVDKPGELGTIGYPNADSYQILDNGVLKVEVDGELIHYSPSYWQTVTVPVDNTPARVTRARVTRVR